MWSSGIINVLCMKESSTLADNVIIRQLQREVLLSINRLYMKESKNVVISQFQREILLSIKGLLNTLARHKRAVHESQIPLRTMLPSANIKGRSCSA